MRRRKSNLGLKLVTRARQTGLGLLLAAAIVVAWLTVHIHAVFLGDMPGLLAGASLVIAQCWLNVGLFIIAHDCMHGSLAPGRGRLNATVGTVCVALYAGFSYAKLLKAHFQHHRAPGTDGDPDFSVAHSRAPMRWFVTFVFRYFGWREFATLTVVLCIYVLALGVPLERMLVFWALPAIASSMQLFYFGTYLPHHTQEALFVDRHNTRSTAYGYLGSLLSCYHFGYHHEHHLHPSVPWWQLPVTRKERLANAG